MADTYEVICEYCGNPGIIIAESEEEAEEKFSKKCECGGFKRKQAFAKAQEDIYNLFAADAVSEEFKQMLMYGLTLAEKGVIEQLVIKSENYSGTVRCVENGYKVTRTYKEKHTVSF